MDLRTSVRGIAIVALLCVPAAVHGVTIGELTPSASSYLSYGTGAFTLVNLSRPALAGGTLNSATLAWSSGPETGCTSAFKIKFFRNNSAGLAVTEVRGPFNALRGLITVSLTPAVTIQAGDFMGITHLRDSTCGGVGHSQTASTFSHGLVAGDPTSGNLTGLLIGNGLLMSVRATSESAPIHGFLPVVGSTQGGFGALFKTAAQLVNLNGVPISGKLVFHRAGTVGSDSDPSVTYTLQPGQTVAFDDVVAATGTTGLGSMDLVPTVGYPPDITTRIYDDKGIDGTAGFTEDLLRPEDAFYTNNFGTLTMPADPANFRLNVGVRTLGGGASITASLFAASGAQIASIARSYPPNTFLQVTASQFLDGATVPANSLLIVNVTAGSLFFYGATTDNRTNDGSLRFPTKY